MPRVKLRMPTKYLFSTEYRVGIADINYGNHLGNDRVLSIAHEARLQFLKSKGYEDELSFGEGIGLIQVDAEVEYKSEAHHGDQIIVQVGVEETHALGFELYYQMTNAKTMMAIALVKTGLLFYDYTQKQLVNMPSEVRSKLFP